MSLRKSIVGLDLIRESDIKHPFFTQNAARHGAGLSSTRPGPRVAWTPTGTNVPDYPRMARLWWANVATAIRGGRKSPQAAMDALALDMDQVLSGPARAGHEAAARRAQRTTAARANGAFQPGARGVNWPMSAHGETIAYERLLQAWREGRVQ